MHLRSYIYLFIFISFHSYIYIIISLTISFTYMLHTVTKKLDIFVLKENNDK